MALNPKDVYPPSNDLSLRRFRCKDGSTSRAVRDLCCGKRDDSDEEKVLGSILLPSYKISPCTTIEGKLFRKKFSFKAEHANMRTYYFASDSREKMVQWMNAMSLASIAQDQSVGKNESRKTNTLAPSVRDKNMTVGFSIPNNWPRNMRMNNGMPNGSHPSNNLNQNHPYHPSNSNNVENYVQPLYVNAPPKPRRIGEPSDSTYDKAVPALWLKSLQTHLQSDL
ncbi:unnamed protein product [Ilex paraguariensis]|uniref:PH domain-containing protein n=1 Tax=Ilex paraguariensis TaxID=185542 RepID=A0ABC8V551_9AQUA